MSKKKISKVTSDVSETNLKDIEENIKAEPKAKAESKAKAEPKAKEKTAVSTESNLNPEFTAETDTSAVDTCNSTPKKSRKSRNSASKTWVYSKGVAVSKSENEGNLNNADIPEYSSVAKDLSRYYNFGIREKKPLPTKEETIADLYKTSLIPFISQASSVPHLTEDKVLDFLLKHKVFSEPVIE